MRNIIMTLIMTALLATPAMAESYCSINGPHNCNEQIEDVLANATRRTANRVEMNSPAHAFKTENDEILANAAREQAEINFHNNTNNGFAFLTR